MTVPLDPQQAALQRALGVQYEIGRLLGRGGMGAVYLAREKALERAVAIKVLPPGLASDAESRERFRREARTAAKLTHPNIVPLYTFGDAEGVLFFVMGYVRGESLGNRMRREGRLAEAEVRRILADLADALDYAHRHGVIHRDIKPDNVLLDDESGRPMLTDFGVAKARASGATLTEAGALVGTPHYMSPEQASGSRDLDGRSDLYSLGVMGYQMLSARLPFEGKSFRDVIVQHVTQAPPPLAMLVPDVSDDLAAAVARCLAKDPALRWPDGNSVRAAVLEPADDATEVLPRELRLLKGSGFWNIVFTPLFLGLVGMAELAMRNEEFLWMGLLVLGAPVVYIQWRMALRKGHPRERVRRLMTSAPRWWPFWWPASWRTPGDVWDRLPPLIRRLRGVRAAGYLVTYTLLLTIIGVFGAMRPFLSGVPGTAAMALLLGQLAIVLSLFLGAAFVVERWGNRHGLNAEESAALVNRPTTDRAFWRRPPFAALLSGAAARPALSAEPQSPADFVRAIADAAGQLTGPVRETGSEAVTSARQLAGAMEAMDAEILQLARDSNPAELAQVEQKLAALGDAVSDHEARRKMRALLEGQRDLLRGLADQLSAATQRRAQLADLLKTLWLQVASLRAEAACEALGASEITGRIRALCEEIARHAQAAAEVRAIARGGGG